MSDKLLETIIEKLPQMNRENRITDRWVKVDLSKDIIKTVADEIFKELETVYLCGTNMSHTPPVMMFHLTELAWKELKLKYGVEY